MQANPPSEKTEHTEVATNVEGTNPPSEAENSEGAGQGGMQADEVDGRQDAEGGLQGDDPAAHSPKDQDQQPQNAADNQPKTGVFGEKYFDGKGEITALMIGGETIDLTKATYDVSKRNHPGLLSNWDTVMVSKGQYQHLIYGAAKLKDGSYTLFVQGQPTEALPEGKAKYQGKVLHFRSQNAADNQPKTGVFGEKYFDGKGEITALMIGGETIDLTKATYDVSKRNHPGLLSNWDTVMVSKGQYQHLIYGAAKLKDGSYTLFVQGQPTEALPEGKAKYQGKVLHFRSRNVTDKTDWLDEGSSYRTTGTFTAEVDFGQKSVNGTINSGDGVYMGTKKFTATIEGSGFKGGWNTKEQGDVEGKFYGPQADEMAGRYDFNKTPGKNDASSDNGFGVFAGKKEASVR